MLPDPPSALLDLTYRPDLQVLIGRWRDQLALAELPAAYEQLHRATLTHGAHRWLQDIRRRSLNDDDTTAWLIASYFPALASSLGHPLRIAYLVGPALHERIAAHPALDVVPAQPFTLALFGEEGAAMEWLQAG
ncbi:MAG: hypothetical protein EOO59_08175 [Hymenobacter sp.]|nr:MAG: hypothetical protein EOO59_08175 [Hymenobacter sp.]